MEYRIKEEAQKECPWAVYALIDGREVFEVAFTFKAEAETWVHDSLRQHDNLFDNPETDKVEQASIQSFPASDPPAWIRTTVL